MCNWETAPKCDIFLWTTCFDNTPIHDYDYCIIYHIFFIRSNSNSNRYFLDLFFDRLLIFWSFYLFVRFFLFDRFIFLIFSLIFCWSFLIFWSFYLFDRFKRISFLSQRESFFLYRGEQKNLSTCRNSMILNYFWNKRVNINCLVRTIVLFTLNFSKIISIHFE